MLLKVPGQEAQRVGDLNGGTTMARSVKDYRGPKLDTRSILISFVTRMDRILDP